MKFTWEGRELKTASANGKNIRYTYNSDGIRTGKTVDGTDTSYFLDGSTVIAQKTGDDVLWFLYDSDGTRVGFTYNGAAYYYMTNAQGDVTGIVDSNVNSVVEYSYDAWGKLLSTTGSMADTVGTVNPFLYDTVTTRRPDCTTSTAGTMIRRRGGSLMRMHSHRPGKT